jgi:hypothetical protein
MEETGMSHPTPVARFLQQAIPNTCTAKTLGPSERMTIGVQALAGQQTITDLAEQNDVSRKFVYQQSAMAQSALDDAFATSQSDDEVLFYVPVTKKWVEQTTLGLLLICRSSLRGVVEFWRDLFDMPIAHSTVHNIFHKVVAKARLFNNLQDLGNVRFPALDEIFQGPPVLVGADVASTYCFLLSIEEHRDADTWAIRLLELQDRNFKPHATIADFGLGLRAGQKVAMPGTPCRGDVFHALYEITPVVTFLDNRAYEAITVHDKLAHKKATTKKNGTKKKGHRTQELGRKTASAARTADKAMALADDVACLVRWLQYDVFAVSGLPYADRCHLYDFIVAELQARAELCPHRLGPVCTLLTNQRPHLLAFAAQLEHDLIALATEFQVPLDTLRELLDVQRLDERSPKRWQREAVLRQQLRSLFFNLQAAVQKLAQEVVRASSVIENLNSRLRNYFFLRREVGPDYLAVLQFFLNHRQFLRSEHPERVGKSPAELLTANKHPHWLEMLGYQRFSQN